MMWFSLYCLAAAVMLTLVVALTQYKNVIEGKEITSEDAGNALTAAAFWPIFLPVLVGEIIGKTLAKRAHRADVTTDSAQADTEQGGV